MLPVPDSARPGLLFLPPRKPWLFAFSRPGSWFYMRLLKIRSIETRNLDGLAHLYRRMQDDQIRLILAFRHPHVDDGPLIFHLMTSLVAREAHRAGVRLRWAPRGYFLYGRDVPVWAGGYTAWAFPRMGGISVFPGAYDSASIRATRRLLLEGRHPMALAPEGQVTYHNERVADLEPGAAQLAFWCREDLRRAGKSADVLIVPVCTSYHYRDSDWNVLDRVISKAERRAGLLPPEEPEHPPYKRLMRLFWHIIRTAEQHYGRFYGIRFPAGQDDGKEALQARIHGVCDAALSVAEDAPWGKTTGDHVRRVLAVRQAGLARIYRADIQDPKRLPPLAQALAARVAAESWLRLRHMELVDILEYLRADYLRPDSGIDRFVEYGLNLYDVINRLMGGTVAGRGNPFTKRARIEVGEPVPVSRYEASYAEDRKHAIADMTKELLEKFRSVAEAG